MFAALKSARRILSRRRVFGELGATSAEYALLATLIVVVISGAVALFGQAVNNLFTGIVGAL